MPFDSESAFAEWERERPSRRPARLPAHQRPDALKALADGTVSQADLAPRINVSQSTI
jgi:hypothetical protein